MSLLRMSAAWIIINRMVRNTPYSVLSTVRVDVAWNKLRIATPYL